LLAPEISCGGDGKEDRARPGRELRCAVDDERRKTVASHRRIEVKPIAGALGAEIASVDLGILDDETFKEIEAAWLEHLVVFFRSQTITP
jgi:Taurine catabolism dioxygenase TauD, TfdA family